MTLYVRSGGVYQPVDFDDLTRRVSGVYTRYQELLVKDGGIYKPVWRADGPPPAPVSLGIGAVNGGIINVGWAYAANEENDYNRVEVQQPGDVARIATNYPGTTQQRSGYAHGTSVVLEARTVDHSGQVSAWTPVPVGGAVNALPPAATVTYFEWNGSGFQLNWNDGANPYGDNHTMQVWYRTAAEGTWTLGYQGAYNGGAQGPLTLANRGYEQQHVVMVRTINNAGYTDSAQHVRWSPPAPGTEKTIAALVGDSWGFNAGGYRGDGTVRQGQFSVTPWGPHYGMFFYGQSALWDMGKGFQANSGEIFMIRHGTEGFTGTVWFEPHGYGGPPASAPSGLDMQWASTSQFAGSDASAWESIPGSVLSGIANGTVQGMGIYTDSTLQSNYKVFKGPALNGFAGVVRLRW